MLNYDFMNWTFVHGTQIAMALIAVLNIFLVRRECQVEVEE